MSTVTLTDVINRECGLELDSSVNHLISSPLRRDNTPSFRVYANDNGAYDFGEGKSYNVYSFLNALHGHNSWSETFQYAKDVYGLEYDKNSNYEDNSSNLLSIIQFIYSSDIELSKTNIKQIEMGIISFLKGDQIQIRRVIEKILSSGL